MYQSELNTIVIDCPRESYAEAVTFWSGLLGLPAESPNSQDPRYTSLKGTLQNVAVLVQAVDGLPEIHIDICTDNKDAEIKRALQLGAREKYTVKRWMVLQAPSGHAFCIVPSKSAAEFSSAAKIWDEQAE